MFRTLFFPSAAKAGGEAAGREAQARLGSLQAQRILEELISETIARNKHWEEYFAKLDKRRNNGE